MDIKDWVLAARKHKGWTQTQLGEQLGRTKGNIGHWETGKHAPSIEQISQISTATGYPLPALGARRADVPNVEPGPDIKGRGRYPLISWVQAGEWTELCDNFQPGEAEDWPVSHHNLGECGYMLRVKGHSMTAPPGSQYSFPEGALLHVNPDIQPVAGQFVIVRRTAEKEATFKRLSMVDGELFLEAINPDWPRRYLPLKEGDVFCGVVKDASFGNLP